MKITFEQVLAYEARNAKIVVSYMAGPWEFKYELWHNIELQWLPSESPLPRQP